MGRRRRTEHHLPERVYESRGWIFYVDPDGGKWHKLGKTWDKDARDKWVLLSTGKAPEGTVADLLDRFMVQREKDVRAGRLSARTLEDNQIEVVMLKNIFGRMKWNAVTSKHVARYLRSRNDPDGNPAPIRANRERALLSSAFSWAMGEPDFDIERNPCYGVRRNPETPRTRYVKSRDLVKFGKEYCPGWLRGYTLLKRLLALRQGDMLALGRRNMTDRGIEVIVGKTATSDGTVRSYRWTWALRLVLDYLWSLHPAEDGKVEQLALFVTGKFKQPRPLTVAGFRSQWRRSINAWKNDGHEGFWEHDIRAKAGSDVATDARASDLLGHKSVQTTKRHYRRGPAKVMPFR